MRSNLPKLLLLACFSLFLVQCKGNKVDVKVQRGLVADSAMVVSARVEASAIGLSILKKGGNAFDAMIATDLALVVAYPFAGNIGGGGFTVFRTADGKVGSLDYREKAPLAAHRDMYLDENGEIFLEKARSELCAVGVPGTIAGLFEIHRKHGSMPFSELIQPAIDLAKRGVVVTKKQAKAINNYREVF